MKGYNKIDKIEFNDDGTFKSIKGHIEPIKVIEVMDMNKEFMSHRFKSSTLKVMFWSQLNIDYAGG